MTNTVEKIGLPVISESEYLNIESGARARAINPLADALQAAGLGERGAFRPLVQGIEAMDITTALASCEQATGELLAACQAQCDARLVEHCISKLAGKMAGAGRTVERPSINTVSVRDNADNETVRKRETGGHDWRDARAAGLFALTVWRHTGTGADGLPEVNAARVAWRAVVNSLSRDAFGESTDSIETIENDWLWHNASQHDESAKERAIARLVAMQAATRKVRLGRRMAAMPAGRGSRASVIEKVAVAAEQLLDGASLDNAAAIAGFNACERSRHSAADALIKACKRLGLILKTGNGGQQFTARMATHEDKERRGEFVPMANTARTLGNAFTVRWDTGLIAVSGDDGCIEWTMPVFSNSPGHADEVLRELAKQHEFSADMEQESNVAPFMPLIPMATQADDKPFVPSPTAGTITVYPKAIREQRNGQSYIVN